MFLRHLMVPVLLLPVTLNAQRTCATPPTTSAAVTGPIFAMCATDLPARFREAIRPLRYPGVLAAAGIRPVGDPVVFLIIDSTGVPVPSSIQIAPGPNHIGFRGTLIQAAQTWRFEPAFRDGHPVASYDSIFVPFPSPPRALVPRDCVDCDTRLYHAQLAVDELRQKFATCAIAMKFVGLWEVVDSTIWAFDQLPTCPGATEAAILAIRMGPMTWKGSSMHFFWERLASIVRVPAVADEALETARRGSRSALRVLAFQATGWARVDDSLPPRWDDGHRRPRTSCGALHVAPALEPVAVDTSLVRRTLLLADSIMDAPAADPGRKTAAWCLKAQLAPLDPTFRWTPPPASTGAEGRRLIDTTIFEAASTDLPPRPRMALDWPRHLMTQWDQDPMGSATVTIFFDVDTLGRPDRLRAPYLRLTDSALARAVFEQFRSWRFHPAMHEGHPVAASDTLLIHPRLGSRWAPPKTCAQCDSLYSSTYWRMSDIPIREIRCDSTIARLGADSITQWDDWMYATAPRCRGVAGALVRNLRRLVPMPPGHGVGWRRATLIASVQDPAIVRELMRAARLNQRYAFRFLPIALGLGYSRVTDTTAGHWDAVHGLPAEGCGPIQVFLPTDPRRSRAPDRGELRRARALADSVVADPRTPQEVRSSAWCLATQLVP